MNCLVGLFLENGRKQSTGVISASFLAKRNITSRHNSSHVALDSV
jgi:hypothetical protein